MSATLCSGYAYGVPHWNSFERCWDWPCHGSQFGIDGQVLNGPATFPLEVEIGAEETRAKISKAS